MSMLTALAGLAIFLPYLLNALLAAGGISWPEDADLLRDIGSAQSILDDRFGADPLYRGEIAWYPPLVPAVIAVIARVADLPPPAGSVLAGPWLNSLGIVAFFVLAWRLFGRVPALLALLYFLSFARTPGLKAWSDVGLGVHAFPVTVVLSLFCAGMLMAIRTATTNPGSLWWGAAGLLTGITFLGHPAPALLLIIVFTAVAGTLWQRRRNAGTAAGLAARYAAYAAGVLPGVALVFGPLALKYQLVVLNPYPSSYLYPTLIVGDFVDVVHLLPWELSIPAALSLIVLWLRKDVTLIIAAAALAASAGLFAYTSYASVLLGRHGHPILPTILPSYHFFFYMKVMLAALAGHGLWLLLAAGVRALSDYLPALLAASIAVCLSAVIVGIDIVPTLRALARETSPRSEHPMQAPYRVIVARLEPDDVILADTPLVLTLVAATGRKTVAAPRSFSNPYLDHGPRAEARESMMLSLADGDRETFYRLARQYRVTHVALGAEDRFNRDAFPDLVPMKAGEEVGIFALP